MSTTQQEKLSGKWTVNAVQSSVTWAVRHANVSWFRGSFEGFEGTLDATGSEPVLEGGTKVENISVRTPDALRGHLLSPEFFDAENHPEITFRSTKLDLRDDGTASVEGDLTIRGNTKRVTGTGTWHGAIDTPFGTKAALELETTINRFDFGVSWEAPPMPVGGSPSLGDEIQITISMQLDPAE